MEDILDKLDDMVKDMDYHGWSRDSHVYGNLTYDDIIRLTKFVKEKTNDTKERYIDYKYF